MTKHDEIRAALDKWVPRLGLDHWDIQYEVVDEMTDDVLAMVEPKFQTLTATMTVLDCDESVELVVLHELIHLVNHESGYRSAEDVLLHNIPEWLTDYVGAMTHQMEELITCRMAALLARSDEWKS